MKPVREVWKENDEGIENVCGTRGGGEAAEGCNGLCFVGVIVRGASRCGASFLAGVVGAEVLFDRFPTALLSVFRASVTTSIELLELLVEMSE